eukprot:4880659-Pyramimonas_sp.AAC.1
MQVSATPFLGDAPAVKSSCKLSSKSCWSPSMSGVRLKPHIACDRVRGDGGRESQEDTIQFGGRR